MYEQVKITKTIAWMKAIASSKPMMAVKSNIGIAPIMKNIGDFIINL